jgi:hypothetical protein
MLAEGVGKEYILLTIPAERYLSVYAKQNSIYIFIYN